MRLFGKLGKVTAVTAGVATAAVAVERTPSLIDPTTTTGQVASSIIALVRFTRSLAAAFHVMADYHALFARHADYTTDDYRADRSAVHERSASRMLKLARKQGAVYVKIGQHVASMNHAVPPEYSTRLKLLEDRAAYRPYWQIERVVSRELGRGLKEVFHDFDRKPVAAASLAQVHFARLQTGEEVAVKVQYPGLESLVSSDLTSIQMLSWLMSWVFPFFNMAWVVEQFRQNLTKELDFALEAESASRTASFFKGDDRVAVPRVFNQHSTSRLLTMEYVNGFRVDDTELLAKAGIEPSTVAQAVVDTFAQMIFVNGFVHCDPHAGNLMVTPGENGSFRLFLLDHGLYRELDDEFRLSYCKLWKGLVLRRAADVEEACAELGAPGFANVFSVFLLNRSWSFAKRLGTDIRVKMSKEEMKQLRSDLRDSGLRSQGDVSDFVENIPDDLLLVFKMNSLVRNVNKALGASVNRFKVNARFAVRGLRHLNGDRATHQTVPGAAVVASTHSESHISVSNRLRCFCCWLGSMFDALSVEMQLFALDAAFYAVRWWFGSAINRESPSSEDMRLIG